MCNMVYIYIITSEQGMCNMVYIYIITSEQGMCNMVYIYYHKSTATYSYQCV